MRLYDPNIARTGGHNEWGGVYFFRLKELAVDAGWTVLASGDGDARYAWRGVTQALPFQQQGSGGGYDCWITGTARSAITPVIAGDATNASAWCILDDPSGRMVLMQHTIQTSGFSGYGRVAATHGGAGGGWAPGQGTGPSTIPDTALGGANHEVWLHGTRASMSGAAVFINNGAGTIHLFADTTPGLDGGRPLGWVAINVAGTLHSFLSCVPVMAEADPVDPDKMFYLCGGNTQWAGNAYSVLNNSYRPLVNTISNGWGNTSVSDPSGNVVIYPGPPVWQVNQGGGRWVKGIPHDTSLVRMKRTGIAYGQRGIDQFGRGWATLPATPFHAVMPWDATFGDVLPAISPGAQNFVFTSVTDMERAIALPYSRCVNRVWDMVPGAFVRWVTTEPDPQGVQYPGPGEFGGDTINYCLESKT